MREEWSRSELLLGRLAMEKLGRSRVAVIGVGGVGGYVAEGLARTGIGNLLLVDSDVVAPSNLNRQIIATQETIGQPKVEVLKQRILSINPDAAVETHQIFYLPGDSNISLANCDYIVDAIDTVAGKIALIEEAARLGIPIISSMGAGNKLDPTRFEVADIYSTSVCPLCRTMRQQLRKRGIPALKVVYSQEPPHPMDTPAPIENGRPVVGSVAFVPSVVGLIIAGEVIKDLTGVR
ncbi:MAG TPA: tRNA threonylcarbamoyladenosine dehydratase [Candidatus Gallacutalibacter stercoravium]|nr:tRNA threonylcarbamoyladenosine dehydratase [Candidatus Gallacutalibacter stercoravium]